MSDSREAQLALAQISAPAVPQQLQVLNFKRTSTLLFSGVVSLGMVFSTHSAIAGTFLQGEISHSDSLPAVQDEKLRPGAIIDKRLVSPAAANLDWHVIPDWYAGHWSVTEETITSYHDFRSKENKTLSEKIRNVVDWQSGSEKDAKGQIWNSKEVPFTNKVILDNEVDYFHERKLTYLDVEPNKVVIEETGYQINTDANTGRIKTVLQEETIHTYKPVTDGEMHEDISKKIFDESGRAMYRRTATREVYRDKAFEQSTSDMLRATFFDFLQSHGLSSLLPADAG